MSKKYFQISDKRTRISLPAQPNIPDVPPDIPSPFLQPNPEGDLESLKSAIAADMAVAQQPDIFAPAPIRAAAMDIASSGITSRVPSLSPYKLPNLTQGPVMSPAPAFVLKPGVETAISQGNDPVVIAPKVIPSVSETPDGLAASLATDKASVPSPMELAVMAKVPQVRSAIGANPTMPVGSGSVDPATLAAMAKLAAGGQVIAPKVAPTLPVASSVQPQSAPVVPYGPPSDGKIAPEKSFMDKVKGWLDSYGPRGAEGYTRGEMIGNAFETAAAAMQRAMSNGSSTPSGAIAAATMGTADEMKSREAKAIQAQKMGLENIKTLSDLMQYGEVKTVPFDGGIPVKWQNQQLYVKPFHKPNTGLTFEQEMAKQNVGKAYDQLSALEAKINDPKNKDMTQKDMWVQMYNGVNNDLPAEYRRPAFGKRIDSKGIVSWVREAVGKSPSPGTAYNIEDNIRNQSAQAQLPNPSSTSTAPVGYVVVSKGGKDYKIPNDAATIAKYRADKSFIFK